MLEATTTKEKHPDPRLHKHISFVKSAVRLIAYLSGALVTVGILQASFIGMAVAEIIGIYEEMV
jgi:hypothetical protein